MTQTIGDTIERLHGSLRQYIEAAYHVGSPQLVEQRRRLLNEPGVIHQQPFIESTPRYESGQSLADLGLDPDVLEFMQSLSEKTGDSAPLIYDPPYEHQAAAIRGVLVDKKSLLVMTGTGSGKTECFLLPILGKLAHEAIHSPDSFATPAVRALVLYPMNALVNDQLGRLRLLFGDDLVVNQFMEWSGRPARFARYTSRTLYPGVRSSKKDQQRLKSIQLFYVDQLNTAAGPPSGEQRRAAALVDELQRRGKWPTKENLAEWYGKKGSLWIKGGEFARAVTMPRDAELFTRHEVHAAPADILVTNYSMLEYMMMRPLERPVFDQTKQWLHDNPDETFLLVVDEAHMYRGAGGAEVALLLRRLRKRLDVPPERIQVICTSASFKDDSYAINFAAKLTGKDVSHFAPPIEGTLAYWKNDDVGSVSEATILSSIDTEAFHATESARARKAMVAGFLKSRDVDVTDQPIEQLLYRALRDYPPMGRLVNLTMDKACPTAEIGVAVFRDVPSRIADQAATVLATLGSLARPEPNQPGLLPCRVHAFFRGLPGLWACMDPNCTELPDAEKGLGPTGQLYAQPVHRCACDARVLELFTCRNCGTAHARAYTNDPTDSQHLWAEAGSTFRSFTGSVEAIEPLDLLLETPTSNVHTDLVTFDLVTGQIDPSRPSDRVRDVYLPKSRMTPAPPEEITRPGQFRPCAVCGRRAGRQLSSVQDHQTKGDQPFQTLITEQIQVQPPGAQPASIFAPLQGRKVLVFADSRQTAARLAPNLQTYSMRDVMRPLIVYGFRLIQHSPKLRDRASLDDLYVSVLLAAQLLGIRLRPKMQPTESFGAMQDVMQAIRRGAPGNDDVLSEIAHDVVREDPPQSLLKAIVTTITDQFYGLESLALASLCESPRWTKEILKLPTIAGFAETDAQKLALARTWLRAWRNEGFRLRAMPSDWHGDIFNSHSGSFKTIQRFITDKRAITDFKKTWLPGLRTLFCDQKSRNEFELKGGRLSLQLGGEWAYCTICRETQRPYPELKTCVNCGMDSIESIDPETHAVFAARKSYYRASTRKALSENETNPMSLVAAEHTAQLNDAQGDQVFSKAEEHELLFQDVDLGSQAGRQDRTAIDILCCTTTMEVGIDIGALSGVALRNMPPGRSNYQQRAGRAGRRGTAIATVTAFGSADSHDEHYFRHPEKMIRGDVEDPILNVDNKDIVERHVTAFLLQRYHTHRLPEIAPEAQPHLFAVLGKVHEFRDKQAILNFEDFSSWLRDNENDLRQEIGEWLPTELAEASRKEILASFADKTIAAIGGAILIDTDTETSAGASNDDDIGFAEVQAEEGEERPPTDPGTDDLLDRLLYRGVLPRYAFPTDVATFHVFDEYETTPYHPVFQYAPSQGLSVALSQYAPGKHVWIDSLLWTSGSIYSPMSRDLDRAWQDRQLYFECERCHYATKEGLDSADKGEVRDCPACGGDQTLGPARPWMRPPGFAHPIEKRAGTSPDDQPAKSYATRAKLTATHRKDQKWQVLNDQIKTFYLRDHLLVTNRGPKNDGYHYCTKCGRVEPASGGQATVFGEHKKPFPMPKEQTCSGDRTAASIVLGTDFITDILLMSVRAEAPVSLRPGLLSTDVALRTVCEALTKAACNLLDLEPTELQAEFRPALTAAGHTGHEAEIYIYDTLSGGAGFSRQVDELGERLFEEALALLITCPGNCDRSCYRCLRSYKNKFEHDQLDRFLGATLLQYMIDGREPVFDTHRMESATNLLFGDLCRQGRNDLTITRNSTLSVPELGETIVPILIVSDSGVRRVVAVHSGLTPHYAPTAALRELSEHSTTPLLVDETLVQLNLPTATKRVLDQFTAANE